MNNLAYSYNHHTEIRGEITPIRETAVNVDLLEDYIKFLDTSPRTIDTYKKSLKQFLLFLADNDITKPTREDIIQYRDSLRVNHKPATVQAYITAVKLFFQWTEVRGVYPDISKHIKGAKVEQAHKKDYLTAEQVKRVLSSIDRDTIGGLRDYAMLSLMVTCGLRDIEVSRANINDLRTLGGYTVLYIQGKGREEKNDYVKVPGEVESILREYFSRRDVETDSEEPLFISTSNNNNGKRLSTRSISSIVKNRLIRAGFNSSRLTAHSLRHTAVTLSLLNGATIQEAQQFARHKNLQTTLIYSHNLEKESNSCSNAVASAIF